MDDNDLDTVTVSAPLVMTDDQEAVLSAFLDFLINPQEQVFVIQGYAGTGKSTLIKELIERLPKYEKTLKLINPSRMELITQLTATTNKAAEAFSDITGQSVSTIHSFLGLRVKKDYQTGKTKLVLTSPEIYTGFLLFIDEASYIDKDLLKLIFQLTKHCKIVFIGDPAQLTPVMSSEVPVFKSGFNTAKLTRVMRQAEGNPIIQLATEFRNTVDTGNWFNFTPDGKHIIHLERGDFEDAILKEFTRPDWSYRQSKVLAWRNQTVIDYNHAINDHLTGNPTFTVGDYMVCNKRVTRGKDSLKTDEMVHVTCIEPDITEFDVLGNYVTLDYRYRFFCPKTLTRKNERIKQAKAIGDYGKLRVMEEEWIDLRAAFAQTVNKSQGSTYNEVFIDLDDIGRCNSGDQIARMLYVAVSRARNKVWITGDF